MEVKDFSVRQLNVLLRDAEHERQRRVGRKPAALVRRLLQAAAAEAGYSLAEVFPEMVRRGSRTSGQTGPSRLPRRSGSAEPGAACTVGRGTAGKKTRASARFPSASETIASLPEPQATARRIVQALKARAAFSLHLSVALDAIVEQLGLREHWPLFHSAMEEANRRNWVHFRGNSHCVLTADGQAAKLN